MLTSRQKTEIEELAIDSGLSDDGIDAVFAAVSISSSFEEFISQLEMLWSETNGYKTKEHKAGLELIKEYKELYE